ncbi:Pentatricopeptide repeat-containing protein [Abeliophyllum distichum]|uniref:Pentatricopeptide repeat-containing protein n=1 Tax=Abeliophyllum distichum TaxID=126358 RepID=A0ABD1TWH6_9LAMI
MDYYPKSSILGTEGPLEVKINVYRFTHNSVPPRRSPSSSARGSPVHRRVHFRPIAGHFPAGPFAVLVCLQLNGSSLRRCTVNRFIVVCMDTMKVVAQNSRHFSYGNSLESSIQLMSPLHHHKTTSGGSDLPTETPTTITDFPRKRKFNTHEFATNLIKRENNPERALEIFNKVSHQRGFNHNNSTYAIILHKLAQCKKYQSLDTVLHQMTYETCKFQEGIFLNLMKHFSKSSLHERVLEMFYTIKPIVREKPSLKAVSTCLNLLVDANQIDLGRTLLLTARKDFHLEPNTCIFNILVKHHCKKGDLESAFEVVKEMEKSKLSYPNLITYSTLMDGLCGSGRLKEAIDLFEEMVTKHQIVPDALTYSVLINGFSRGGKTDRARKIMEFMKKNGCNPNVINYSAMMNGFCREGRLKEAKETFDEMKSAGVKPDTVIYTTLINFLCRAARTDEAIVMLKEMKENECKADEVTFNVILGGLCREFRFDEALDMLERLPYDGVYLNKASYRIVLNFLCKEGELEKAVNLLHLMLDRGFLPHFATSNELLVRLCEAGKANDAAVMSFLLIEMGFKPEPNTWSLLIDVVCRERKLLPAFKLVDTLIMKDF